MSPLQPAQSEPMRGPLALRSAPSWFRYFGRRVWTSRYAVLQPATASSPPRLLLFLSESMDELHEELLLLSPVQLDCLANDGTTGHGQHANFTLSSAGAAPIELSAPSDDERQQWIFHLGESMLPSPASSTSSSPVLGAPAAAILPSQSLNGQVSFAPGKVSEKYRMGRVLAQGEDYLVVLGQHLQTGQSHALKLLSKHSKRLRLGQQGTQARTCSRLLGQCLEELYEGPNHVCLVMRWGSHELDERHELSASVLEALRLLREVVPDADLPPGGLVLSKADAQRLLLRAVALDCHLQSNLFI